MTDIVEWAQSKYGFYVDRHYIGGKWVLQPGPIRLADYHARILRHIFTPDEAGRWPYDTIAWCEPAKSGKSAIAGLVSEYVALHGEQNSAVLMASNKQDQAASLMYKSLTDSIEFNPHLKIEPNKYEVSFRNGCTVRAIPSNSKGEAGARFSLALFDELWAYVHTDALRLWSEFKIDPTRLNSLKLAVGYAGYSGESELWQNLLETGLEGQPIEELSNIINEDGSPCCFANGRLFVFWSHLPRQPWQTQEWLDSQAKSLIPAEFRRMIKTEFVPFTETSFTQVEWWDSCYSPLVRPIQAGDNTPIVVALDLASGTLGGDTIALVGVSKWGEAGFAPKFIRVYEPGNERFDYDETAGKDLWWLIQNCNVMQLSFDPFQALNFIKQFQGVVWCKEFSQQTERTLADKFLYDLILGKRLAHDGNPVLKQHILNAGSKSADDGRLRLVKTHPRKKIDLAVALSMGVYRASLLNLSPDPASVGAHAKLLARIEQFNEPLPEAPKPTNGTVRVEYQGDQPDGSLPPITLVNGTKAEVYRGEVYEITEQSYQNLLEHFRAGSWRKV